MEMPADLRLCLSLSGGASLGAYQAGATAALLVALSHLREEQRLDVRLDAVGGASAGAIVGMMAAHSVLEGTDGCEVMFEAWVEGVSIDTLLRRGSRGPLSLEGVREGLPELQETVWKYLVGTEPRDDEAEMAARRAGASRDTHK